MENLSPIKRAVEIVGSQAKLAKGIGMSPSMMNQVYKGERSLPDKYCRQVEDVTGGAVSRTELTNNWKWYWPELQENNLSK